MEFRAVLPVVLFSLSLLVDVLLQHKEEHVPNDHTDGFVVSFTMWFQRVVRSYSSRKRLCCVGDVVRQGASESMGSALTAASVWVTRVIHC